MASAPATPITTRTRLTQPLNGTIFTTRRGVATEKPVPTIGATMASELGPNWATSLIIATAKAPEGNQDALDITHAQIPSEADQLASNWEQTRISIGGRLYPAVIRTVILKASEYSDTSPARGSAMPVEAGSIFTGDGYVLYDRECVKTGLPLEPVFRVDRRTYIINAAIAGEQTNEWGVLDSTEQLVDEGSAADHAEGVAQSSVSPIGNGYATKQTVEYPAEDEDGIIAMLSDQDEDGETGIVTDIDKLLVVESEAATVATTRRGLGWLVEKKADGQNHSILICSKVDTDSLPAAEVFWDSDNIRLPDTLSLISVTWNQGIGGGSGNAVDENGNGFSGSTRASASASVSAVINVTTASGFAGRTKVKITRRYQTTAPTALVEPYNIIPVTGSIAIKGQSRNAGVTVAKTVTDTRRGTSNSLQESVSVNGRTVRIGPFLSGSGSAIDTESLTVDSGTWYATNQGTIATARVQSVGEITVSLPTSTPATIASGDLVSRYQVARKWRLGIWVVETIEVYAP